MEELNGVRLAELRETIRAVKSEPELAECRFRAKTRWKTANQNTTRIDDFYAAKEHMHHKQVFEIHADEPPLLAGDDAAPNPVEQLLSALGSCLTTSIVAHAAMRGIAIDALETEVEGDIDLSGYMGLSPDKPRGYRQVRVTFTCDSNASNEQIEELARYSPVFNTVANGAPVSLEVRRGTERANVRQQRASGP